MHAAIADNKEKIAELCRGYGVGRLEVFGSAARATDFDPKNGDADSLVEFGGETRRDPLQQFFGFADALEAMLGRRVDLVEERALKNPYVLATVNEDRETVYEA
jgi:predicted nucleotidyltransferase